MSPRDRVWIALAILILCGAAAERLSFLPPPDSAAYHAGLRDLRKTLPNRLGDWSGEDQQIPPEALELLRPNIVVNRTYTNLITRQRCSFLLIQTADARDLAGHYPPACYPGRGWKLVSDRSADWPMGDEVVQGSEYEFSRLKLDSGSGLYVANSMVFPGGGYGRTMEELFAVAYTAHKRHYGAAQIQVVLEGTVPAGERQAIVSEMLRLHRDLIEAIHRTATVPPARGSARVAADSLEPS